MLRGRGKKLLWRIKKLEGKYEEEQAVHTLQLGYNRLEDAGASVLTVHGRTREAKRS